MQADVFLLSNDNNKLLKQRAYIINKHSNVITHIVIPSQLQLIVLGG